MAVRGVLRAWARAAAVTVALVSVCAGVMTAPAAADEPPPLPTTWSLNPDGVGGVFPDCLDVSGVRLDDRPGGPVRVTVHWTGGPDCEPPPGAPYPASEYPATAFDVVVAINYPSWWTEVHRHSYSDTTDIVVPHEGRIFVSAAAAGRDPQIPDRLLWQVSTQGTLLAGFDADQDTVTDAFDRCPDAAGPWEWDGCPPNSPPTVNAGADLTVAGPAAFTLRGRAADDALPASGGGLTLGWSQVSGPGRVAFTSPGAAVTKASTSAPGTYVLRLTAYDGQYRRSDDVKVTATPDLYAGLGDSFSSGEGARPYQAGTDTSKNRCHRSTRAYAASLAKGVVKKYPRSVFKACSGATTEQFWNVNDAAHGRERAQVANLGPWTGLVTLSFGGNNVGFEPLLANCVTPGYKPCQQTQAAGFKKRLTALGPALRTLYAGVRQRAPHAKAIVLGYPRLFPAKPPKSCAVGSALHIDKAEAEWLNTSGAALNKTIATAARAAGFSFADPTAAFNGHEMCSRDPWFVPIGLVPASRKQESMHPTVRGQAAFAVAVSKAYAALPR